LVVLQATADMYMTPDGPQPFVRRRETLRVKGGDDEVMEVIETRWGPLLDSDHRGRPQALRWVAHDPPAVNLNLLRLETAANVDEALDIASRAGMPGQNFLAAGRDGRIGWTIAGPIPRRFGHDGRTPESWADGRRGWEGYLPPPDYPRITDPPLGRLWTANNRVVSGEALEILGDGGYALGARARQIRDDLLALDAATEADLLAVQLDDRALFLHRWRALLLAVLTPRALENAPRRRQMRALVEHWDGRAAADSAGYRLVRTFRNALAAEVFSALTAPCRAADPWFDYGWINQSEGPLWQLASRQPPHLLNSRYPDWQAQFLAAVDTTLDDIAGDGDVAAHPWGERNTLRMVHPFSLFIPALGRFLDMPAQPLPGDVNMPRVQTPTHGASQRLVVAPGREAQGILHMPGGQSGHPLSPHYRDGHDAWVRGEATPFLPGPAVNVLRLVPDAGN
ncbi:MAG: penicillin acylase family protein, partial [Pseudomonadota bacterium]|nr:penicillin acylase family protein [Pseudomonadota bacterium]